MGQDLIASNGLIQDAMVSVLQEARQGTPLKIGRLEKSERRWLG